MPANQRAPAACPPLPTCCPQSLLAPLLQRCIPLFAQEVDKRAGPLVGQLLGLGLTGTEAARCFERCAWGVRGRPDCMLQGRARRMLLLRVCFGQLRR